MSFFSVSCFICLVISIVFIIRWRAAVGSVKPYTNPECVSDVPNSVCNYGTSSQLLCITNAQYKSLQSSVKTNLIVWIIFMVLFVAFLGLCCFSR